jgi:hypothetical protein
LPEIAALTVIAISGRLVATESRTTPPSAAPRWSRSASTSVYLDSEMPAPQITAAEARKIASRTREGRDDMELSLGIEGTREVGTGLSR